MRHTGKIHAPNIALAIFKLTEAYDIIDTESREIKSGFVNTIERIERKTQALSKINESIKQAIEDLKPYIQTPDQQRL